MLSQLHNINNIRTLQVAVSMDTLQERQQLMTEIAHLRQQVVDIERADAIITQLLQLDVCLGRINCLPIQQLLEPRRNASNARLRRQMQPKLVVMVMMMRSQPGEDRRMILLDR